MNVFAGRINTAEKANAGGESTKLWKALRM